MPSPPLPFALFPHEVSSGAIYRRAACLNPHLRIPRAGFSLRRKRDRKGSLTGGPASPPSTPFPPPPPPRARQAELQQAELQQAALQQAALRVQTAGSQERWRRRCLRCTRDFPFLGGRSPLMKGVRVLILSARRHGRSRSARCLPGMPKSEKSSGTRAPATWSLVRRHTPERG